jgi:hypothetical protein
MLLPGHLLMVNAHDIVSFEFVGHSAVAGTSDHGGHAGALLHEVFLTDGVVKTLTYGNIAKFDTITGRVISHK